MGLATTIIIILIIVITTAFIILIIANIKKLRQPIITGKLVDNMLYKFTGGHRIGSLIKKEPVGKEKDSIRMRFTVKTKDEYDEDKIIEKSIIVKKFYLLETDHKLTICPKDIVDVNSDEIEGRKIKDFIREQNGLQLLADATKQDKQKFIELFKKGYGGELSMLDIDKLLRLKELASQTEEEVKKD